MRGTFLESSELILMSLELVENVSGMNVVILKKVQHQMLYRWSPLCIGLYIGSHRWII